MKRPPQGGENQQKVCRDGLMDLPCQAGKVRFLVDGVEPLSVILGFHPEFQLKASWGISIDEKPH